MLTAGTRQKRCIERKSLRSAELFKRGQRVISGGNARLAAFQRPYPIYFEKGEGAHLIDVDGNSYIDFLNNFTSLIHGHGYPPVLEQLHRQLDRGLSFGGPSESEVELAELLCARVPYFDQVRFMGSGTEAVMYAIKAARALTGRPRIAKFEGGFHGSYDPVEASLDSSPENWGELAAPAAVPFCQGTPRSLLADTIVVPFNDIEASRVILEASKDELAAVVIDPLPQRVGLIPIDEAYLAFLRAFTARHGIVLISDEVMSFRLSYQGGISRFGFEADLCAFGKIVGGGLPIGAVGGPSRFMAVFDPSNGKPPVPQSGTFSANPVSMVAGAAAMKGLPEESFARLEALGDYARASLGKVFERDGLPYCITGLASTFRLHLQPSPPSGYRDAYASPEGQAKMRALVRGLQERGLIVSPTCQFCLSTPMTKDHVDEMVATVREALHALDKA